MHIPDGYLGPKTFASLYAITIAVWTFMFRKLKSEIHNVQVPLVSLGGAFSFIIMMFNFPVPGGSSMHIVGAGLLVLILGPSAAILALSICLIIQAFLFGDGGITALGANCFNIAIVSPLITYYTRKILKHVHFLGIYGSAAIAVYFGVIVSSLLAGIELGLQPVLEIGRDGNPLFCPYPLSVTVPAMVISHAIFVGPVEIVVTILAIKFLLKTEIIKGLYE
jgi:cobalt/nickel transport system permease protein